MDKTLNIGNKEISLRANASTPIRYKQIFDEDLLQVLSHDVTESRLSEILKKLAYVMNAQSEQKDFKTLNFDTFCDWLEMFGVMELEKNANEIMSVYTGQAQTFSEQKKKQEEQSEN